MNVFVILPPVASSALDTQIETLFAGNCLRLTTNQWLVAGNGTAREISDRLGVTAKSEDSKVVAGPAGAATVFAISGYFGLAPTNIWEWLKTKMETTSP